MLKIACPFCGSRDETEFSYGGDATQAFPALDADPEVWASYVFDRDNPCGTHREYWHHLHGCRQWLVVERDTFTDTISAVQLARGEGT